MNRNCYSCGEATDEPVVTLACGHCFHDSCSQGACQVGAGRVGGCDGSPNPFKGQPLEIARQSVDAMSLAYFGTIDPAVRRQIYLDIIDGKHPTIAGIGKHKLVKLVDDCRVCSRLKEAWKQIETLDNKLVTASEAGMLDGTSTKKLEVVWPRIDCSPCWEDLNLQSGTEKTINSFYGRLKIVYNTDQYNVSVSIKPNIYVDVELDYMIASIDVGCGFYKLFVSNGMLYFVNMELYYNPLCRGSGEDYCFVRIPLALP